MLLQDESDSMQIYALNVFKVCATNALSIGGAQYAKRRSSGFHFKGWIGSSLWTRSFASQDLEPLQAMLRSLPNRTLQKEQVLCHPLYALLTILVMMELYLSSRERLCLQ